MTDQREAFLTACRHAHTLVSREEVAEAWGRPSALDRWSVGGLAAHLAGQATTALRLLEEPPGPEPIALEEHYRRSAWVTAGIDGEVNVSIREGGEQEAGAGRDAVLAGLEASVAALPALLAAQPDDRAVLIPWNGWSLALDDFLVGRTMEVVVHGEDLAASVGFTAPTLPDAVLDPVVRLLAHLAAERHGQGALVSALTRSERAPRTISAF